jgi:hypothetical protein
VGALLHQRTDYAAAMTDGRVAAELDPASKSAEEIGELWTNVLAYVRKGFLQHFSTGGRKTAREEVTA